MSRLVIGSVYAADRGEAPAVRSGGSSRRCARAPDVVGPQGVGMLGAVVDTVVAARRVAAWALWVELVGLAQLLAFWEDAPPIVDEGLHRYGEASPDPCAASDPDLADRLHHLVIDWQLPRPVNMYELAEAFVTSEISAASGASRRSVGLRLEPPAPCSSRTDCPAAGSCCSPDCWTGPSCRLWSARRMIWTTGSAAGSRHG
jgi:hypothetical protein